MDIGQVSNSFHDETFEQLTETGTFVPWVRGRLAPVDRFLSNFHKPLQRRMLFTKAETTLPASGVVKQSATGEIYLVGQSRLDVDQDKGYSRLSVLHTVTGKNAGKVEYFNYNYDQYTVTDIVSDDIGKRSEGNHFIAVEYISTKSQEYGDEAYQGKLVAFGSNSTPFRRDGVFDLNGKSYKVIEDYIDSDFHCAVILEQPDDMQKGVYSHVDETSGGYDVATGEFTYSYVDYKYPVTVDQQKDKEAQANIHVVYVKHPSPLTNFVIGNPMTLSGKKTTIIEVNKDANVTGQVQLVCEA